MSLSRDVYDVFSFPGIERTALFAFILPDAIVISLLSLVVAIHSNRTLQAIVFGGFAYGALWCVAMSIVSKGGYLSSQVMLIGTAFNLFLLLGPGAFRVCRSVSRVRNGAATFIQSAIIWTTTLLLFPLVIVHAVGDWPVELGVTTTIFGVVGFVACSALGIWSATVMVTRGEGTPLPLDAPKRLVVAGPYAYVRAPMAIAGLGQGFSVALILTSWAVALYVVIGMFVWNHFIRPYEERYLVECFGAEYEDYRENVRCWLPLTKPYLISDRRK